MTVKKLGKWILAMFCLVYGSALQVGSHGDLPWFAAGSVLVLTAFGLILGWRWGNQR